MHIFVLNPLSLSFYADAILEKNRRILAFDNPRKKDVVNIQNWVENTSSLAREETAYLLQGLDDDTLTPGCRLGPSHTAT